MTEKVDTLSWWQPSLSGLYLGGVCCAATFWPSLVPRPWAFQGVLSGLIFALGYWLGVFLIGLWNYLELPSIRLNWRRVMYIALICTSVLLISYGLWNAAQWQNVTRNLMDMPEVEESYYMQIIAIGGATALSLLLADWGCGVYNDAGGCHE